MVAIVLVHAQQCYVCKSRLATRSYVDPEGAYRVWICDAARCAKGAAEVEITDAPNAAGIRYANLRARRP